MDKKVSLSMPESLLSEVDELCAENNLSRSECIKKAVVGFVSSKRREKALDELKRGYEAMGNINSSLSEEGIAADNEQLLTYELRLSESE